MTTTPTPQQVRDALAAGRAGRLARPSPPVDLDAEAARRGRMQAGLKAIRAAQARESAELARFCEIVGQLYGRPITAEVRLMMQPVVTDLRATLGRMPPAPATTTVAAQGRDSNGRFTRG